MAHPTLIVEGFTTSFSTRHGEAVAVNDISFSIERGQIMGLVGESESGKSITGLSTMGLVDKPGRISAGRIVLTGRDGASHDIRALSSEALRQLRGNRIAMIFQDPMMSLNPVLRIDTQMIEAIQAHERVSSVSARERARNALAQVGIPSPDERLLAYPRVLGRHAPAGGHRHGPA
jgi:peptide/nickel transport system ATP-binding protein